MAYSTSLETTPAPELVAIMRFQRYIETNLMDLEDDEVIAWKTEMEILHDRLTRTYRITDKRSFRDRIVTRIPSNRR